MAKHQSFSDDAKTAKNPLTATSTKREISARWGLVRGIDSARYSCALGLPGSKGFD
jgi:hypothetical protein